MGKTMRPAVAVIPPICTTLVSNKLEAIKQTLKSTPKNIKGTVTVFCIFLFFTWFIKHTGKTGLSVFPNEVTKIKFFIQYSKTGHLPVADSTKLRL